MRQVDAQDALRARGIVTLLGDLADPQSLASAAKGCDVVYQCAGSADHGGHPDALSWVHVAGTENVVRAAAHVGVRRVVLLSCADVMLRDQPRIHIKEDQPQVSPPLGAWARTKLLAEEVGLRGALAGLEVTAVRPGFLWGAGDRTNLPGLCREALSGGIRLYSSGTHLLSVSHLDNVIHGLRLAASAPAASGQAFHVCDGEYETALQFFSELSQACGMRPPRRSWYPWARNLAWLRDHRRLYPLVVRRGRGCLLDMQRAINDLGYQPVVERKAAFAELGDYVAEQGGLAQVARYAPEPLAREAAQVFERLVATGPEKSPYGGT